jgi:hypothetical protein
VRHEDAPGGEGQHDRKGERFTLVQQALGRRFEAPFEGINYEPLSSNGTRFTPRIEAEPGSFFGLLDRGSRGRSGAS